MMGHSMDDHGVRPSDSHHGKTAGSREKMRSSDEKMDPSH